MLAIKNNSYKIFLKPPKKLPQPLLIATPSLRLRKFEWLHRDIWCQCWPDLNWPFTRILLTQRLHFLKLCQRCTPSIFTYILTPPHHVHPRLFVINPCVRFPSNKHSSVLLGCTLHSRTNRIGSRSTTCLYAIPVNVNLLSEHSRL